MISERINILIELLEEIKNIHSKNPCPVSLLAIQPMLYDSIDKVAEKTDSTPHHVERTLNDVVVDGDMRFNIISFCNNITDWLNTADKSAIRDVLIKNISPENHNSDMNAIENWYRN